ncbi:MAG: hypothetical protein ABFD25_19540, partial [Clostridiaceae bacterium]
MNENFQEAMAGFRCFPRQDNEAQCLEDGVMIISALIILFLIQAYSPRHPNVIINKGRARVLWGTTGNLFFDNQVHYILSHTLRNF